MARKKVVQKRVENEVAKDPSPDDKNKNGQVCLSERRSASKRRKLNNSVTKPVEKPKDFQDRKELSLLNQREAQRRILAIKATRDVQIDSFISHLQLARSMLSKAELDKPLLQYLRENCPNIIPTKNSDNVIELEAKPDNNRPASSVSDASNLRGSAATRVSYSVDNQSDSAAFPFGNSAVNENFLGSIGVNFPNMMLEEPFLKEAAEQDISYRTPTMQTKMQSSIITPKSSRLPKKGELMLSVHGSPIYIFSDDKMGTIKGIKRVAL